MELIQGLIGDRPTAGLLDLPASTGGADARLIELLLTIQPPAFLSDQIHLFALMACKNLALTLSKGLGPLAPSVFAMYALVERIILDDARASREFAGLAVELDRRSGGTQTADVLFLKSWFVDHWVRPVREVMAACDVGARAGLATGEVLYGCYNHGAYVALLAASGEPLPKVVRAAEDRLSTIGRRVTIARFHCVLERQMARALAGQTDSPTSLTDASFDESRDLAFICRTTNANQVGFYHVARLKLLYYRGDYQGALLASDHAIEVAGSFARQPAEVDLVFFRGLALLASVPVEPEPGRSGPIEEARGHLDTLRRWRVDSEANFAHKALLVEAELARSEGKSAEARSLYIEAIRSAEIHGFRQHAALASHLAARHLLKLGEDAGVMLQAAIEGYRTWGANALADRLDAHS